MASAKYPILVEIITDSLVQLKADQGHHLKFIEILSATHPVVAGFNYTASVKLKHHDTSDDFTCNIKIWTQSWVKFRQFEATCPEQSYKVVKGTQAQLVYFKPRKGISLYYSK